MTGVYIALTNEVREVAMMGRPHPHDYSDHKGYYLDDMEAYTQHIASLRTYLCSPECKEVWKDGETVEFELKDIIDLMDVSDWGLDGFPVSKQYAYPITQLLQEEDRLWREVMGQSWRNMQDFTERMKQSFTITRKQQ